MNILWVSAHPDPRSLTASIRDTTIEQLQAAGHHVEQSDLYAMQWNPVVEASDYGRDRSERMLVASASKVALDEGTLAPELIVEQTKLRDADVVILQFPLWWFTMPAILKGWVDRVFIAGFGYLVTDDDGHQRRYGDGMLTGKRAMVVVSTGSSAAAMSPRGLHGTLDELLFPIQHGVLFYTGMSVLPPFVINEADKISSTEVDAACSELLQRVINIETDSPIPFRPKNGGDYDRPREVVRDDIAPREYGFRIHTEPRMDELV